MQAYGTKPIKPNDDVSLWAMGRIASLREIISRQLSVRVDDDVVSNVDCLQNFVLDNMAGALSRFQEMAITRRIAIAVAVSFILVTIGLFAFNRIDWAFGALSIAVVLIADVALRE